MGIAVIFLFSRLVEKVKLFTEHELWLKYIFSKSCSQIYNKKIYSKYGSVKTNIT